MISITYYHPHVSLPPRPGATEGRIDNREGPRRRAGSELEAETGRASLVSSKNSQGIAANQPGGSTASRLLKHIHVVTYIVQYGIDPHAKKLESVVEANLILPERD